MTDDPRSGARRGLFRRVIDWLLWDGEDDLDEVAQPVVRDAAPAIVRSERVNPPKHSVDSIDWIAFAEGRPQADDGGMITRSEDDQSRRAEIDDFVEVPPDSGVHTAIQDDEALAAFDGEHEDEQRGEAPLKAPLEPSVLEPVAAPVGVEARPELATSSRSAGRAVPTTAELMASIEWD